jgi:anti-sigma regulatory factor (Ser/Thr protein kinase)
MSTPADIDFRVFGGEVIELCRVKGSRGGARRAGRQGPGLDEPETRGYLMDTMCVDSTTIRSATAVADARETTRAFLEALWQPAVGSEAADTVVLVVSELVTNALRHGGGTSTLRLTAHPDVIEVAVDDTSSQGPRMRTPDLNGGNGGFGWAMVNRLARSTAVTRRPSGGKTVSAPLSR